MSTKKIIFGILLIFVGMFIGGLIKGLTEFSPEDLIANYIHPPKPSLSIEPLFWPVVQPNGEYIQINLRNDGKVTLNNLVADYQFGRGFQNLKGRANLSIFSLNSGQTTSFYIFPKEPLSCTFPNKTFVRNFYYNKDFSECFHDSPQFKRTCIFKEMSINVSSKEFSKELTTYYPVKGGETSMRLEVYDLGIGKICKNIATNETEGLILWYTAVVEDFAVYPPAYCAHGLLPKERCVKEGFNFTSYPVYKATINGQTLIFDLRVPPPGTN